MPRSEAHTLRNQHIKASLSDPQAARKALQPTRDVVLSETERLGTSVRVQNIPSSEGANLHWVGSDVADTVVLYIHGTGPP